MTISAIGAVILGYIEEAAALAFLYSIAEALEDKAMDRARAGLRALLKLVPESATIRAGGATVEDVRLMRRTVGPDIGVKASGGIRTREQALAMVEAGATRIGASQGIAIIATGEDGGPESAVPTQQGGY